jgi:hypothetical protein
MKLLMVLGLPRSGTSLVHKLIQEETGRKAIYLKDLDLEIPRSLEDYHKVRHMAEIHDIPSASSGAEAKLGDIGEQKKWIEKRGVTLVKSVEPNRLPDYIETFPSAEFIVCVRDAGAMLASVQEYFLATGLRWNYNPTEALQNLVRIARAVPEKFRHVDVEFLPQWESQREPVKTFTAMDLNYFYNELRGITKDVTSQDFKRQYS